MTRGGHFLNTTEKRGVLSKEICSPARHYGRNYHLYDCVQYSYIRCAVIICHCVGEIVIVVV